MNALSNITSAAIILFLLWFASLQLPAAPEFPRRKDAMVVSRDARDTTSAIDDWMDEVAWRRLRRMVKFIYPRDSMPFVDPESFAACPPQQLAEFPPGWVEHAKVSWQRPDGGMAKATIAGACRQPRKQPE